MLPASKRQRRHRRRRSPCASTARRATRPTNNVLTLAKGSLALIGVTLTGRKRGAGLATGALQVGSDSQVANALLFESAIENSI